MQLTAAETRAVRLHFSVRVLQALSLYLLSAPNKGTHVRAC